MSKRGYILKPCPFCGSIDVQINNAWPHYVFCADCNAEVRSLLYAKEGEREAVDRWNRREETSRGTVVCVVKDDEFDD